MDAQSKYRATMLVGLGVALVLVTTAVAALSPRFAYGGDPLERPTWILVALLMGAGAIYLAACWLLPRTVTSTRLLMGILGIGVALRATLALSTPILEDDFYRYFWDGAVTAHGVYPYAYAPIEVTRDAETPASLRSLASTGPFQRVNHPELGTIYPPVAQASFALAYVIGPWSLAAWRGVLLVFDAATLGIVLLSLRAIGRPLHGCAIYWWNPVVLVEIVNSAHMDALVLPFVAGAFYFAVRGKPVRSTLLLALGAAVKVWPLIVAPLLLRGQGLTRLKAIALAGFGALLTVFLCMPLLAARRLGADSGFVAYGERWEMNDAVFLLVHGAAEFLVGPFALNDATLVTGLVARGIAASVLALIIAGLSIRVPRDGSDRANRVVLVLGAMFMLSPTQFPWYYTWMVPFLALKPRASFLVLSMMLPMYYLKFWYDARNNVDFFHNVIVWIEYAPVFALLGYEAFAAWRARTASTHA